MDEIKVSRIQKIN